MSLNIQIIAIGSSTGGPKALEKVLSGLPQNIPVPILVVQHIAPGFIQGLADWIKDASGFPCHVARHRERILPGHVYFAPDDYHMEVGLSHLITLNKKEPECGLRPTASHLLRSVADIYRKHAIGVLLTGMGKDGAVELKLMKDSGATTIVQDKESSVVHGMPGEAIKLGAAMHILPPAQIAVLIAKLLKSGRVPVAFRQV